MTNADTLRRFRSFWSSVSRVTVAPHRYLDTAPLRARIVDALERAAA